MKQPPGFTDEKNKDLICKLSKALYGLKGAAERWSDKLTKMLLTVRASDKAMLLPLFVEQTYRWKMGI